ncbi:hypothetical protein Tco_1321492 [Tanacetum coccineum]
MAQTFLATQVSDICVGKPSLRSLPSTASIAEAVAELKKSGELYVSVWECDHHNNEGIVYFRCLGKICMVDVIVFLCEKENILCPLEALKTSVVDLVMNMDGRIRHLEPDSRSSYVCLHGSGRVKAMWWGERLGGGLGGGGGEYRGDGRGCYWRGVGEEDGGEGGGRGGGRGRGWGCTGFGVGGGWLGEVCVVLRGRDARVTPRCGAPVGAKPRVSGRGGLRGDVGLGWRGGVYGGMKGWWVGRRELRRRGFWGVWFSGGEGVAGSRVEASGCRCFEGGGVWSGGGGVGWIRGVARKGGKIGGGGMRWEGGRGGGEGWWRVVRVTVGSVGVEGRGVVGSGGLQEFASAVSITFGGEVGAVRSFATAGWAWGERGSELWGELG